MNIRLTEREGVREDGRRVYVWEIERERERDQLKLSKFPFRGIILAEPRCLGCLEGN